MNELSEDVAAAAQELLEADLAREFARIDTAAPPPLSIEQINSLLAQVEAGKQQILCHPDDFERVSQAVNASGLGLYFIITASLAVDAGQVVLLPPQRDVMTVQFPQLPY